MSAAQAAELADALRRAGVRSWVVGGWGIDALLGRATREHHDLDLLVDVVDLPALVAWLRDRQFRRQHVWPESREVRVGDVGFDTAFVEAHEDRRELDVHAVEIDAQGRPRLVTGDPWSLPMGSLDGVGRIHGVEVACVTSHAQVALHDGYELPRKHREDLARLAEHLST